MSQPDSKKDIKKAVEILKNGGIIVYPTETVYGIGCDPLDMEAYDRVQRLKKRMEYKPMLLLAYSLNHVEEMAGSLSEIPRKLAEKFWPGPLTIIIKPRKNFPEYLLGPSHGAAFRVSSHPVAASLAKEFGRPIISTSANITGQAPMVTYEKALNTFENIVDIVIGTHEILTGKPSTVVDLTSGHFSLVRKGNITLSQLKKEL